MNFSLPRASGASVQSAALNASNASNAASRAAAAAAFDDPADEFGVPATYDFIQLEQNGAYSLKKQPALV
ncbi:hypothetical protein [Nitrosomonas sp.]|uniref:hypothetical protein n=1 Tax=Nitrosomonas sp. TaxID=42353 RepID=UPI0020822EC2|nr:hypothetical protein [Nitrosomonas sp.]GJL76286.1 MAG: hypothetical protein NMNS02_23920 [Nitrosomonas sp.]